MALQKLLNVLVLVDLDRSVTSIFNFNTEKLLCDPQILHLKSFTKALFDRGYLSLVFASDNEIINIEGNICSFTICILMDPNAGIRLTLLEVKIGENFCDNV